MDQWLVNVSTVIGLIIYIVGGPATAIATALAWQLGYRAFAAVFGFLCLTLLLQLYGLTLIATGGQSTIAWLINRGFQIAMVLAVVWSCVWMWRAFVERAKAAGVLPDRVGRAIGHFAARSE
ncbi:MAG: hypothetical protein KDE24_13585 [Caldilinea sp.]|nr:hypothetical protein [Caldilinea sp.]